jgi:hypothetical protein
MKQKKYRESCSTPEKAEQTSPRERPDWPSFFAMRVDVPPDFLAEREGSAPQPRGP